ncbi:hypothetical protein [Oceanobacillus iheyensis HTE831]|uniref:Uncharacterized protein n=1 Tax=Oceanobacillus iheyensis (strain DSM 14371 / CIP 107618 / JCM 11309 / KCTC 3954 / HTE831) TaxID=221109 RepID=Q8EN91_OCEIH|nr:Phr family secreted Rap phosphatase inhibitor [Oceanobacillus iheyensis]BAC14552.1 hypothetical protein [Oceanobacillus iheyensis HTE831]
MKKINYLLGIVFLLTLMVIVPSNVGAEKVDLMSSTYQPTEEEHPDPSEEEHPEPSEEEHPDPS